MQRKVQQKQSTAQQVLIPIIIDPVEQPEEPVVTPRPGGEKILQADGEELKLHVPVARRSLQADGEG